MTELLIIHPSQYKYIEYHQDGFFEELDEVNTHASNCETHNESGDDLFKEDQQHSNCNRDPLDFDNIIAYDGVMHALHNLAEALREAMPSFKTEVRKLKHLVRLLRSYDTRQIPSRVQLNTS